MKFAPAVLASLLCLPTLAWSAPSDDDGVRAEIRRDMEDARAEIRADLPRPAPNSRRKTSTSATA